MTRRRDRTWVGCRAGLAWVAGLAVAAVAVASPVSAESSPGRAPEVPARGRGSWEVRSICTQGGAGAASTSECWLIADGRRTRAWPLNPRWAEASADVVDYEAVPAEGGVLVTRLEPPDPFPAARSGGHLASGGAVVGDPKPVLGERKLLLVRVDFEDVPGQPFDDARFAPWFAGLQSFFQQSSLGRMTLAPAGAGSSLTPTFRMPRRASEYARIDLAILRADALAAALGAGFDSAAYDLDLVCLGAVPSMNWTGQALVGARGAWIRNVYQSPGIAAHELGHNLGLSHANLWDTKGVTITGAGSELDYGDFFDTMGAAQAGARQFNARSKHLLGWLADSELIAASSGGLYTLYSGDQPGAVPGARALRIGRGEGMECWVELRQLFSNSPTAFNGLQLRWTRPGFRTTALLDTTPGTAGGATDASLTLGRTFSDPVGRFHLTPLKKNATDPESMEVALHFDAERTNSPPVIVVATIPSNAVPGVPVTFSVEATDPDGDTLAASWSLGDGTVSGNALQVTATYAVEGEYVVRCVVSDLRGGRASVNGWIRVGAPATRRIQGRLTRAGAPVEGLEVFAANGRVGFSDSAGVYLIAGVTNASVELKLAGEETHYAVPAFPQPLVVDQPELQADFTVYRPEDLEAVPFVPAGAEWSFQDNGQLPPSIWTGSAFPENLWRKGAAPLGYGYDDLKTVLGFGPNPAGRWVSYQFRRRFQIPAEAWLGYRVRLQRDDGALVFLDGREVWRENLPGGFVNYLTFASVDVDAAGAIAWRELLLDPATAAAGEHVVAVEVHQVRPDSPDVRFDAEFAGLRVPVIPPPPPPVIAAVAESGNLILVWEHPEPWQIQVTADPSSPGGWQALGDVSVETDGARRRAVIPIAGSPRFYRLSRP